MIEEDDIDRSDKKETWYLDNEVGNLKSFRKHPFVYSVFLIILLLLWVAIVSYAAKEGRIMNMILSIIYLGVFVGIGIVKAALHKKHGRKFVEFTTGSLILKNRYFAKAISIPWRSIQTIRFTERTFVLEIVDSVLKEMTFKVPLDRYMDIRKAFRKVASNFRIAIEE